MGVYEARGMLEKAMKDLNLKWSDTRASWDDAMSKAFEEKYLLNLRMDMRNAVSAMDHMAVLLQQAYHDCSE